MVAWRLSREHSESLETSKGHRRINCRWWVWALFVSNCESPSISSHLNGCFRVTFFQWRFWWDRFERLDVCVFLRWQLDWPFPWQILIRKSSKICWRRICLNYPAVKLHWRIPKEGNSPYFRNIQVSEILIVHHKSLLIFSWRLGPPGISFWANPWLHLGRENLLKFLHGPSHCCLSPMDQA